LVFYPFQLGADVFPGIPFHGCNGFLSGCSDIRSLSRLYNR